MRTYLEANYDPRITKIDGTYYITFAAENRWGCQIGLARTCDFKKFDIMDAIAEPDNRNIVLFPRKINGMYWRMDRPFSGMQGGVWVSQSPGPAPLGPPPEHHGEPAASTGTAARSAPAPCPSRPRKAGSASTTARPPRATA